MLAGQWRRSHVVSSFSVMTQSISFVHSIDSMIHLWWQTHVYTTCSHELAKGSSKAIKSPESQPEDPSHSKLMQTPISSKEDSQRLPYDRSCRRHSNSWKECGVWKWPRRAVQVPTCVHSSWKSDVCIVNLVTGATGTTGTLGCRRFCPRKLVCKETWRVQSLYGT